MDKDGEEEVRRSQNMSLILGGWQERVEICEWLMTRHSPSSKQYIILIKARENMLKIMHEMLTQYAKMDVNAGLGYGQ